MTTSFPRLIIRAALLLAVAFPTSLYAQIPAGSSARSIPNEIERADGRISQIINRAETYYKEGELHLKANEREQARDKFDKAVDSVLESGLDVRANARLQTFYLELVERIYRLEVPSPQLAPQSTPNMTQVALNTQMPANSQATFQQGQTEPQQIGFREQKFEPSNLDELSKLILTPEEQNVSLDDVAGIEIAKNSIDFGFNTNPLIQQFINYYQGRGRSTMESGIRRSGQFMKMARKIFKEEGVPEDITWLGQVESAWRAKAYSHAAASGLWQFIPGTGQRFGLRQTAWVDERNSYEKATRASARYLKFLARRYNGNWELAMAAYNTGEGNIDRAISRAGSSNFWNIYPYIAQETRNYVPNILATILIAKNPEKYGFRNVRPDAPLSYDTVEVATPTSLQLIAQLTGTSIDHIRMLNPELRRDVTPRGEAYRVRLPGGRANQFVAQLKEIPANRRDSAPSNNNVVPTVWSRAKAPGTTTAATGGLQKVKARAGDTIAKLAAQYKVSADELARLNGMAVNAELQSGQEIKVPQPSATTATTPSRRRSR
jgi:membrane-bound lytic murein transglycosylase D